jgi:3-methyladenine DNA glycosylase AlkD
MSQGAMTWALLESLKTSSNKTWRELIKSMRELLKTSEYEQIPQFASGNFIDIDSKVFI